MKCDLEGNCNVSFLLHSFTRPLSYHLVLLTEHLLWARHCCKAVDTGRNMTGQVLISWSLSSSASHQEATAGMGEGDGEGCEPPGKVLHMPL